MLESFTFTVLVLGGVGLDTTEDIVVLDMVGLQTTEDTVVLDTVGWETTEDTVAMDVWKLTDEDVLVVGVTSDTELEEKLGKPDASDSPATCFHKQTLIVGFHFRCCTFNNIADTVEIHKLVELFQHVCNLLILRSTGRISSWRMFTCS